MAPATRNPRILIVTPEVTYLPDGMGNMANYLAAKAGGLADVSAALVSALYQQGADVHVAMPDYRGMYSDQLPEFLKKDFKMIRQVMPNDRIHLAEDRAFFYMQHVYSNYSWENMKIALAFQREVINNIVPRVRPDLIHCNDWMTGLIPAMSRQMGTPCLFTIHNIHTMKTFLAQIEDRGIDAAYFWQHLFYENMAYDYEETREQNPIDLLASGVFAAHFVNTVSPTFLREIVEGRHGFVSQPLQREISNKYHADCALGILNAPDPSFNPVEDPALHRRYSPAEHVAGKAANKHFLQNRLGLIPDPRAPVFFWPSRLDTIQKGCELLAATLYDIVSEFWQQHLQIVFVASGEYKTVFKNIVGFHDFTRRVAICDFNEDLARLAYGAADFIFMPSRFEPCGLPQMIGPIYGALPVAHDTGGIHDTVAHLDIATDSGNGFLFEVYDSEGLQWATREAMRFFNQPRAVRAAQIERIMVQSAAAFNHAVTAQNYIDLYEKMLQRPLIRS